MFNVHVTRCAEEDIAAVLDYLLAQDAAEAAANLWQSFEDAFASLQQYPARGLSAIGFRARGTLPCLPGFGIIALPEDTLRGCYCEHHSANSDDTAESALTA